MSDTAGKLTSCLHHCQELSWSHDTAILIRHSIQKVDCIKDLGILFDSQLNFKDHIQDKINKAYSMIGLLKKNFINMDCDIFILLYKALVYPHLEYANSKHSAFARKKIQKRAIKPYVNYHTKSV